MRQFRPLFDVKLVRAPEGKRRAYSWTCQTQSTSKPNEPSRIGILFAIFSANGGSWICDSESQNEVKPLLLTEEFPSRKISKIGLNLAEHCKESLNKIENGKSYR